MLGSTVDRDIGPVLMFGTGGSLVEVLGDHALGLSPLNTTLASRMMEQTRIYSALSGARGNRPVDLPSLEKLLVRFSQLVLEQIWIREIDVNPILASADELLALDARVVLYPGQAKEGDIVRPAIRPYPSKYISDHVLLDGTGVRLRPIRAEDEPLIVKFHGTLSEQSVYRRYFLLLDLATRTNHDRLTRICFIDYDREMALVAECQREIVGVGRLIKNAEGREAEISIIVSDAFQRRSIGSLLMEGLLRVARDEQLECWRL